MAGGKRVASEEDSPGSPAVQGWGSGPWFRGVASSLVHTHWLGLAPKASRSCTAELWPSSADRKSPVCPAEFSPSTWTAEGHRGLALSPSPVPRAGALAATRQAPQPTPGPL